MGYESAGDVISCGNVIISDCIICISAVYYAIFVFYRTYWCFYGNVQQVFPLACTRSDHGFDLAGLFPVLPLLECRIRAGCPIFSCCDSSGAGKSAFLFSDDCGLPLLAVSGSSAAGRG